MLKRSNVSRFTLLTELLTRLGLNCDKPTAPSVTPVCLLAASQVHFYLTAAVDCFDSHQRSVSVSISSAFVYEDMMRSVVDFYLHDAN